MCEGPASTTQHSFFHLFLPVPWQFPQRSWSLSLSCSAQVAPWNTSGSKMSFPPWRVLAWSTVASLHLLLSCANLKTEDPAWSMPTMLTGKGMTFCKLDFNLKFNLKWKHFGFQFEIQIEMKIEMKTFWISIWNSNWNPNCLGFNLKFKLKLIHVDFKLKFRLNWKQFWFQFQIQIYITYYV